MFLSTGASRKWRSIACAPASSSRNRSMPAAIATGSPIADHSEYRPPTQSHVSNTLPGSIPNSTAAARSADTAAKCRATASPPAAPPPSTAPSPLAVGTALPPLRAGRPCPHGTRRPRDTASALWTAPPPKAEASQRRAARAFAIVSRVVKVLDATMNSVRAGSSPARTEVRCAPSRLETKCTRGPPACGASARQAIRGPRSDPPMPMFTTSVIRSPVWPRHCPERTAPEKRAIASNPRSTPDAYRVVDLADRRLPRIAQQRVQHRRGPRWC